MGPLQAARRAWSFQSAGEGMEIETETWRGRQAEKETPRDIENHRETEKQRQRQRCTERYRKWHGKKQRDKEGGTEQESET